MKMLKDIYVKVSYFSSLKMREVNFTNLRFLVPFNQLFLYIIIMLLKSRFSQVFMSELVFFFSSIFENNFEK